MVPSVYTGSGRVNQLFFRDLDGERPVELPVGLPGAVGGVPERIADDPGLAGHVVEARMRVSVDPEGGSSVLDDRAHVVEEEAVEPGASVLRVDAPRVRQVVGDHDVARQDGL